MAMNAGKIKQTYLSNLEKAKSNIKGLSFNAMSDYAIGDMPEKYLEDNYSKIVGIKDLGRVDSPHPIITVGLKSISKRDLDAGLRSMGYKLVRWMKNPNNKDEIIREAIKTTGSPAIMTFYYNNKGEPKFKFNISGNDIDANWEIILEELYKKKNK